LPFLGGLLFSSVFLGCKGSPAQDNFELKLRAYIDQIRVVDTHEHLRMHENVRAQGVNFFTIIGASYLKSDLISAGSPSFDNELIAEGDLDKLWSIYGPWLDKTRNTSYYGHLVEGFRVLYGFDEPYFTRENIGPLSSRIAINYSDYDSWYLKSFQAANLDLIFTHIPHIEIEGGFPFRLKLLYYKENHVFKR